MNGRPRKADELRTHWVYRLFAADGTLLYIGVSVNVAQRWREHRSMARWWPLVARSELTQYADGLAAYTAESAAIQSESPAHNIMYTPKHRERSGGRRWNYRSAVMT